MFTMPSFLDDFKIWMNPTNLKLFKKREVLTKLFVLPRSTTKLLEIEETETLAENLLNNKDDLAIFALRIYFFQLFSRKEICLDLRPSNFIFDHSWGFNGTRFAYCFSNTFLSSLKNIYLDFYLNQGQDLESNLEALQLIDKKWPQADKEEFKKIFIKHFNSASKRPQFFKLKELYNSFTEIFSYLQQKKMTISTDFAMLGIYLTTLYMTLGESSKPINAHQCFTEAYNITQNKIDE